MMTQDQNQPKKTKLVSLRLTPEAVKEFNALTNSVRNHPLAFGYNQPQNRSQFFNLLIEKLAPILTENFNNGRTFNQTMELLEMVSTNKINPLKQEFNEINANIDKNYYLLLNLTKGIIRGDTDDWKGLESITDRQSKEHKIDDHLTRLVQNDQTKNQASTKRKD